MAQCGTECLQRASIRHSVTDLGRSSMNMPTSRAGDQLHAIASKKAALHLMPVLMLIYFMAFIDRTNVGLAKTSLEADVGIGAAAYGLGAGIFFLSYALLEVPSNLVMHRVGPAPVDRADRGHLGRALRRDDVRAGRDLVLRPALPARRGGGRPLPRADVHRDRLVRAVAAGDHGGRHLPRRVRRARPRRADRRCADGARRRRRHARLAVDVPRRGQRDRRRSASASCAGCPTSPRTRRG